MFLPTLLAVTVTVAALVYVSRPFFGKAEPSVVACADGPAARRLELVEERDRAVAALKELEFDHLTGKVSDMDYREQVGPLRLHAVEILRALEPVEPPVRPARARRETRPGAKVRS